MTYAVKLERSSLLRLPASTRLTEQTWPAWAARRRRPLAADLFAGGGGLSLGLERAGYRVGLAHSSGRTLASVVALAARAHAESLVLPEGSPREQLDVSRPVAAGTVPVTLRLNGAQRQLLDDLAATHGVTRSAIVNAALRGAAGSMAPPPGAPQTRPATESA